MSLIFWALLAAVGAVVLAVLCLPARLEVSAGSDPLRWRVGLRLAAGLVPAIRVTDSARPKPQKHKAARPLGADRGRRMLPAALRLVRDLVAVLTVETCAGHLRFGLGDPADTGQLFGAVLPLQLAWPERLTLTPDFDGLCLAGQVNLCLKVLPVRLLPPLVRFGWAIARPVR